MNAAQDKKGPVPGKRQGRGHGAIAKKAVLLGALLLGLLCVSGVKAADTLNTWEQVRDVFRDAARTGKTEIGFTLSASLLAEARADNSLMWYWAARGGARDFSWSWYSDGRISAKNVEYWSCPWAEANDRAELVSAVGAMRGTGARKFVLLLEDGLFNTMISDRKTEQELLLEGGLRAYGAIQYHRGSRYLEYSECRYWDGGLARVSSEKAVLEAMERFGNEGYDAFALSLDRGTWDKLKKNDWERLNTLETLASLEGGMTFFEGEAILVYQKEGTSTFFPGYRILRAVARGEEGLLPSRLRQTLDKARALLTGIKGTQKEMALAIHDLLCEHITYTIDESTNDDDRCVGALLNGKANCDGYADAYMLLCGLKGIEARLWHGDDLNYDDPLDDRGHLWNLVLLDGVWRSVDVTWDDGDQDETSWIYWNIGTDRMSRYYTYVADLLPDRMLEVTDLLDRPVPEFEAGTVEQAMAAVREAGKRQAPGLVLWMTDALFREYRSERNPVWNWLDLSGVEESTVTYSDREKRVNIRVRRWNGGGLKAAEADTEEKAIAALRQAAAERASEIRLYLSAGLFSRYQGPENPVWKWMNLAGIVDGKVSHSESSRRISITEMAYNDGSIAVGEADTEAEAVALMRRAAASGAAEIRAYLGRDLFALYQGPENPVWKWMNLGGIMEGKVSYSETSRRVVITQLRYNDGSVAVGEADTEKALIAVLRGAAASGSREIYLYLGRDLYARYQADNPIWKWMDKGGVLDAAIYYSDDSRRLVLSDPVYNDGSVAVAEADTEAELIAALKGAGKGTREVRLYLGRELYARFSRNGNIVWTWLEKAGFRDASVQYSDRDRRIVYIDPVR